MENGLSSVYALMIRLALISSECRLGWECNSAAHLDFPSVECIWLVQLSKDHLLTMSSTETETWGLRTQHWLGPQKRRPVGTHIFVPEVPSPRQGSTKSILDVSRTTPITQIIFSAQSPTAKNLFKTQHIIANTTSTHA